MPIVTAKAADFAKKVVRMNDDGNGWNESYRYVAGSTVVISAGSTILYGIIPAGIEVNGFKYVTDANTGSFAIQVGYSPVNANDGPAANLTYWIGAATPAATAGTTHSVAQPILFEYPVIISALTSGANASATAVTNCVVNGKVVGIK